MKNDSTTYDIETGKVVKEQPEIIIKKGKRKISPFYEQLLKTITPEMKARVEKQMTCFYYFNGGDCSKGLPGTPCILEDCVAWRLHPDFEKK